MWRRARELIGRLTLAQQFMLASLAVLLSSMLAMGWWVAEQIEIGVVERAAATTALYVDSFLDPPLQELATGEQLTPQHMELLSRMVGETPLGQHIVAFKVWDTRGRVVFDTDPSGIGKVYPIHGKLARALAGEVVSGISDLEHEENVLEKARWERLIETYSPVNLSGSNQVIAVVEFYQTADSLAKDTAAAQIASWIMVGLITLSTYALLAGIVRRGSNTISRQQRELNEKVVRLTALLEQNQELNERVRRAASRTTALNERFLRRIGSELHDGPAQDIGLALLRLDTALARMQSCALPSEARLCSEDLPTIESSLRRALQELRSIAAGLRLPELHSLTLSEALARLVRVHERRTDTKVALSLDDLPAEPPLSVKITLYRLVQEALSNAYRHGGGVGQQVRSWRNDGHIHVEVIDQGAGFDVTSARNGGEHLGLVGMRERVESIGGEFRVESAPGQGTQVSARVPIEPVESDDEQ